MSDELELSFGEIAEQVGRLTLENLALRKRLAGLEPQAPPPPFPAGLLDIPDGGNGGHPAAGRPAADESGRPLG